MKVKEINLRKKYVERLPTRPTICPNWNIISFRNIRVIVEQSPNAISSSKLVRPPS